MTNVPRKDDLVESWEEIKPVMWAWFAGHALAGLNAADLKDERTTKQLTTTAGKESDFMLREFEARFITPHKVDSQ